MLAGSKNWARTPPRGLPEEPEAGSFASTRTTSRIPARTSWQAVLVPITSPPMTTTAASLDQSEDRMRPSLMAFLPSPAEGLEQGRAGAELSGRHFRDVVDARDGERSRSRSGRANRSSPDGPPLPSLPHHQL